jgi:hypothetical protein
MKLVRELTDEEIEAIAVQERDYEGYIRPVEFARALFEAAWIKQQSDK